MGMDLEIIILSKVSQRKILDDITYMWILKDDTNELIYKTNRLTDLEIKFMVTEGEEVGEG